MELKFNYSACSAALLNVYYFFLHSPRREFRQMCSNKRTRAEICRSALPYWLHTRNKRVFGVNYVQRHETGVNNYRSFPRANKIVTD